MNENIPEPSVITLPLSTLEGMQMEICWRIDVMMEIVWEGIDLIQQIKEELGMNRRPNTSQPFDPFRTIGK
jgi:hypothetical protein